MHDTSYYIIRAILGQKKNKKSYVVYYTSKTLNDTEMNYTTTEKELLAVASLLINYALISLAHVLFYRLLSFEVPTNKDGC